MGVCEPPAEHPAHSGVSALHRRSQSLEATHRRAHAPEMKPEQKQEQAVTPQREIAPKQEQGEDFGLGL
jgi:hypothetical protein